jgi:hypothetical protein
MELGALIGSAVEAARSATESLGVQGEVQHEAWTDQVGGPRHADAVPRQALVVEGRRPFQTMDGTVVQVEACLTFFPVEGEAPFAISKKDRFTLPSGLCGPVVEVTPAMVNPATGQGHLRVVWIGGK